MFPTFFKQLGRVKKNGNLLSANNRAGTLNLMNFKLNESNQYAAKCKPIVLKIIQYILYRGNFSCQIIVFNYQPENCSIDAGLKGNLYY